MGVSRGTCKVQLGNVNSLSLAWGPLSGLHREVRFSLFMIRKCQLLSSLQSPPCQMRDGNLANHALSHTRYAQDLLLSAEAESRPSPPHRYHTEERKIVGAAGRGSMQQGPSTSERFSLATC
jgi:hypothetical protein